MTGGVSEAERVLMQKSPEKWQILVTNKNVLKFQITLNWSSISKVVDLSQQTEFKNKEPI